MNAGRVERSLFLWPPSITPLRPGPRAFPRQPFTRSAEWEAAARDREVATHRSPRRDLRHGLDPRAGLQAVNQVLGSGGCDLVAVDAEKKSDQSLIPFPNHPGRRSALETAPPSSLKRTPEEWQQQHPVLVWKTSRGGRPEWWLVRRGGAWRKQTPLMEPEPVNLGHTRERRSPCT